MPAASGDRYDGLPDWKLRETLTIEGRKIAWDRFGSGPPLVFVHGTPFSSFVWKRVIDAIRGHFTCHVFDLLGYGQSEMGGFDVSLGIQNGVMARLFDHWAFPEPPGVIAHDFGGATSLRCHLLDGVEFNRLLLFDPVAVRPWGSPFVRHVKQHEAAFAGMPAYMHEALLGAYLQTAVFRQFDATTLNALKAPWIGPVGQPAFYRQIAQMDERHTDPVEEKADKIRCPVRLLWGVEDEWMPFATGQRLAAMLPGTAIEPVTASGHLMQFDAPEAIAAATLDFFGK